VRLELTHSIRLCAHPLTNTLNHYTIPTKQSYLAATVTMPPPSPTDAVRQQQPLIRACVLQAGKHDVMLSVDRVDRPQVIVDRRRPDKGPSEYDVNKFGGVGWVVRPMMTPPLVYGRI